jgi:hypothetical protein
LAKNPFKCIFLKQQVSKRTVKIPETSSNKKNKENLIPATQTTLKNYSISIKTNKNTNGIDEDRHKNGTISLTQQPPKNSIRISNFTMSRPFQESFLTQPVNN